MQIFVKPYYRTLTLDVRPSDTVAIVKSMIHYRTEALEEAVPLYKMTLAYAGKPLPDHRKLEKYGITNQATLTFGINVSAKPRIRCGGPHVLYLDYPAERKAFSSDCFYTFRPADTHGLGFKVRPADTIRDLKRMVLDREGIVCTCFRGVGVLYDYTYEDGDKLSGILPSGHSDALPTLRVVNFSRRARALSVCNSWTDVGGTLSVSPHFAFRLAKLSLLLLATASGALHVRAPARTTRHTRRRPTGLSCPAHAPTSH